MFSTHRSGFKLPVSGLCVCVCVHACTLTCLCVCLCVICLGRVDREKEGKLKGREFSSVLVLHIYSFDPFLFR